MNLCILLIYILFVSVILQLKHIDLGLIYRIWQKSDTKNFWQKTQFFSPATNSASQSPRLFVQSNA